MNRLKHKSFLSLLSSLLHPCLVHLNPSTIQLNSLSYSHWPISSKMSRSQRNLRSSSRSCCQYTAQTSTVSRNTLSIQQRIWDISHTLLIPFRVRTWKDADSLDVVELIPGSAVEQTASLGFSNLCRRASSYTSIASDEHWEESDDQRKEL